MSNTPAEVETQGSSLNGNTGSSNTGSSNTGSSSEGVITTKAMTSSMVPGPLAEDDAVGRSETVIVGRQARQARKAKDSTVASPNKHIKVAARVGENNNSVVQEENNNTVVLEGRHKLPPLVIRGPRVLVARKVGGLSRGLSRGLRKGRAQQLNTVAKVVAEEAVRAVLGEQHGNASSPQAEEELPRDPTMTHLAIAPEQQHVEQEQETHPAKLLEVTVKATSSESLVFIKRPCQPRPRSSRCDELLPVWKTKALRGQAKLVLKGVRDEQLRQSAGACISLQLGEGKDKDKSLLY